MTLQQCYSALQGDYQEAVTRLMNDRLVARFIQKFPIDPSMQQLRDMTAAGNNQEAFRAVHTLKGVAANLAFTKLFQDASALTEQLRDGTSAPDAALLSTLEDTYTQTLQAIEAYTQNPE